MHHPRRRSLALLTGFFLLSLSTSQLLAQGIERSFDVGDGGRLTVKASGTTVDVVGGGSGVELELLRGDDSAAEIEKDYEISMRQNGNDVIVEIEKRSRTGWLLGRRGLDLNLVVPDRFDLDLASSGGSVRVGDLSGEILARTSGGSIHMGNIAGAIQARTSGGSITIDGAGADVKASTSGGSIRIGEVDGRVEASTSGGSINIARSGADVVATTSGGSIEVSEVAGSIDASTSGGSIRAFISQQPGDDSSLSTSGGKVEVVIADGIGLDVDAKASSGVRSDVAITTTEFGRSRLVGSVNGGGPQLRLRASGGSVRLRSGR